MDAELILIRRLNLESRRFQHNPTVPKENYINNVIKKLNTNMAQLKYNSANKTDSDIYVKYLVENIYLVLRVFNKMGVCPTYFFDELLSLVTTCVYAKISHNEIDEKVSEILKNNRLSRIERHVSSLIKRKIAKSNAISVNDINELIEDLAKKGYLCDAISHILPRAKEINALNEKKREEALAEAQKEALKKSSSKALKSAMQKKRLREARSNESLYDSLIESSKDEFDDETFVLKPVEEKCLAITEIEKILAAVPDEKCHLANKQKLLNLLKANAVNGEVSARYIVNLYDESFLNLEARNVLAAIVNDFEDKKVTITDVHDAIKEYAKIEIPTMIRGGLKKGKYNIKFDKDRNIDSAYCKVIGALEILNIPCCMGPKETSQYLEEMLRYHSSITEDIGYRMVNSHIECFTRLLFEYLSILAMVGENPKDALNKYIKNNSKRKKGIKVHPIQDTWETIKKINFTDNKIKAYGYSMLVLSLFSWTLKAIVTSVVDVVLPIPENVIDILTIFSSAEMVVTLGTDRYRGIVATISSLVGAPFILIDNIVKGVSRKLKFNKGVKKENKIICERIKQEEERERQQEMALKNQKIGQEIYVEMQGRQQRKPEILNESIEFKLPPEILALSTEEQKQYTDKEIAKTRRICEILRDKILSVEDPAMLEYFLTRLYTKCNHLNNYFEANKGMLTSLEIQAYTRDQISILRRQVSEEKDKEAALMEASFMNEVGEPTKIYSKKQGFN